MNCCAITARKIKQTCLVVSSFHKSTLYRNFNNLNELWVEMVKIKPFFTILTSHALRMHSDTVWSIYGTMKTDSLDIL